MGRTRRSSSSRPLVAVLKGACHQEYSSDVRNNAIVFFFIIGFSHDEKEVSIDIKQVIRLGINDFVEWSVRL